MRVVVVVLPSLPVTPIRSCRGTGWKKSSISEVTVRPPFSAAASSWRGGRGCRPGVRKITSNRSSPSR